MPLFSHRPSSTLPDHYSKSGKSKKPLSVTSQSRPSLSIIVFSAVCFAFGIGGVLFAVTARTRHKPLPVFRCGRSQDTFRSFYQSSSSRKLGGDGGGGAVIDRPKLLGFVGIQTGFSSGHRRAALRSTWFPPDPDGLLRYIIFSWQLTIPVLYYVFNQMP